MNAKEFCKGFAELIGREFNNLSIFDRRLMETGLRRKGSGRAAPEYNRPECVKLLLAFLSGRGAIYADAAAEQLAKFEPWGGQDFSLLADLVSNGRTPQHFENLNLADLLVQLLDALAADSVDKKYQFWLVVEAERIVLLQIVECDGPKTVRSGEITFAGVTDSSPSRYIYWETRTLARPAFDFVAANTVAG